MIYIFVMLLIVLITLLFYFVERSKFISMIDNLNIELHKEYKDKTDLEGKLKHLLADKEEQPKQGIKAEEIQLIFNKVDDMLTKVKMLDDKLTFFNTTFKAKLEKINEMLYKNIQVCSTNLVREEKSQVVEDQNLENNIQQEDNINVEEVESNIEHTESNFENTVAEAPVEEIPQNSENKQKDPNDPDCQEADAGMVCSLLVTPLDTEKELFGDKKNDKHLFEEVFEDETNTRSDGQAVLNNNNETQKPKEEAPLDVGELNSVIEENNGEAVLKDNIGTDGFNIKDSIEKLRAQLQEDKKQ